MFVCLSSILQGESDSCQSNDNQTWSLISSMPDRHVGRGHYMVHKLNRCSAGLGNRQGVRGIGSGLGNEGLEGIGMIADRAMALRGGNQMTLIQREGVVRQRLLPQDVGSSPGLRTGWTTCPKGRKIGKSEGIRENTKWRGWSAGVCCSRSARRPKTSTARLDLKAARSQGAHKGGTAKARNTKK